jgi:DNA (cytosine-5)-methyltransferase 1
MLNIRFYLDTKSDKNYNRPLHLVIVQKGIKIKVAIGEKIKASDWSASKQFVRESYYGHKTLNNYLSFLKNQVSKYLEKTAPALLTSKNVKDYITSLVNPRKKSSSINIIAESEELYNKEKVTFIDLFAGAGGFSEGFLQAETPGKHYDFLLANDINENCELTHRVRYNHQLGLDAEFITQDRQ